MLPVKRRTDALNCAKIKGLKYIEPVGKCFAKCKTNFIAYA